MKNINNAVLFKFKPFSECYIPEPNTGCWLWTAGWHKTKYGMTSWNLTAHRASYELHFGPIPKGMVVCHKCDTRPCVNPSHLFLGTTQDNIDDRVKKGRTAHGAKSGKTKITERQFIAILGDTRPYPEIAETYGISRSTVGKIKRGETWKYFKPGDMK